MLQSLKLCKCLLSHAAKYAKVLLKYIRNYVCISHDYYNCFLCIYVAPTPRIFLRPNYLQQGAVGESHDLVCLIALSSTAISSSINLIWNFTSNDNRVTVIPTNITTDDSIGIIYTTVIRFDYLSEMDEGYYTCSVIIEEDYAQSTFNLETISKHK